MLTSFERSIRARRARGMPMFLKLCGSGAALRSFQNRSQIGRPAPSKVPAPLIRKPSQPFALISAGLKLGAKCPSMRVRPAGKWRRSVEQRSTAPPSRCRLTLGLRNSAPLTNTPLGTTTVPPPCAATWSMVFWMAAVLTVAASATAPNSVMEVRRAGVGVDGEAQPHRGAESKDSVKARRVERRFGMLAS